MKLLDLFSDVETMRDSKMLLLWVSNLDLDLLPSLYGLLDRMGIVEKLDVVIVCHGGAVTAARRIALLLRRFTSHLSFIVPYYCESAATILILAADEIVAGPLALFSPVDPQLHAHNSSPETQPPAISSEDIRNILKMCQEWFGLHDEAARRVLLTAMCESMSPSTMTSFYRASNEVQATCLELLSLGSARGSDVDPSAVVNQLMAGYHSHTHALSAEDLARFGLPIRIDDAVIVPAWEMTRRLEPQIGGASRATFEEDWFDAIIALRGSALKRRRSHRTLISVWEPCEIM